MVQEEKKIVVVCKHSGQSEVTESVSLSQKVTYIPLNSEGGCCGINYHHISWSVYKIICEDVHKIRKLEEQLFN